LTGASLEELEQEDEANEEQGITADMSLHGMSDSLDISTDGLSLTSSIDGMRHSAEEFSRMILRKKYVEEIGHKELEEAKLRREKEENEKKETEKNEEEKEKLLYEARIIAKRYLEDGRFGANPIWREESPSKNNELRTNATIVFDFTTGRYPHDVICVGTVTVNGVLYVSEGSCVITEVPPMWKERFLKGCNEYKKYLTYSEESNDDSSVKNRVTFGSSNQMYNPKLSKTSQLKVFDSLFGSKRTVQNQPTKRPKSETFTVKSNIFGREGESFVKFEFFNFSFFPLFSLLFKLILYPLFLSFFYFYSLFGLSIILITGKKPKLIVSKSGQYPSFSNLSQQNKRV
jgi:hypothetical protein